MLMKKAVRSGQFTIVENPAATSSSFFRSHERASDAFYSLAQGIYQKQSPAQQCEQRTLATATNQTPSLHQCEPFLLCTERLINALKEVSLDE